MCLRVFSRALIALTLISLVAAASPALAQTPLGAADSFLSALDDGQGSVSLNYRVEYVDEDGFRPNVLPLEKFEKEAWASTLRTAIRYQTMQYWNLDLFLEAANVTNVGYDAYNSTQNGHTDYPVVADPSLSMMNQAFLRYSHEYGAAKLGRQELVYDNSRFVGNVGWRQNHQNFDAFRADVFATDRINVRYTYVDRVHTVVGSQADLMGNLVNLNIDLSKFGAFGAYAYMLDFDDAPALSTGTFGGFLNGKYAFNEGPWGIKWRAEYAMQQDMADNANTVDAKYMHFMGGFGQAELAVSAGFEQLSGSVEDGQFTTAFATGHKFNGWADKFLKTPLYGLNDLYVGLGGMWDSFGYMATWHNFEAESSNLAGATLAYGTEIDAQVSYKTSWKQVFAVKAALYTADDEAPVGALATDVTKVWFWTSFNF
jgi:hypothetical protein